MLSVELHYNNNNNISKAKGKKWHQKPQIILKKKVYGNAKIYRNTISITYQFCLIN